MTPDEREEVYESLQTVIDEHGMDGLEAIVDALVTLATAEAAQDPDEWADVADELLVLYGNIQS